MTVPSGGTASGAPEGTRFLASLTSPHARRWRVTHVLLISLFIGYLDRVNISLALPLMAGEYGWTTAEMTSRGELLFSLFYVGYGLANIFLSPLAARFGPRRSLLVIVVLWSFFTAIGAFVSQILLALAACRLLLGLSEGVHFPMMNMLTRAWFPPEERGRANSIWISGLFLAVLLSPMLLVPAMSAFGWRIGFWGLAVLGLLITFPLIWITIFDQPSQAPSTSEKERAYLAAHNPPELHATAPAGTTGRVRRLARSPLFLLLLLAGMLNNIVALGLTSWLPSFFVTTKGLAFEDLTWAVSLPFAGALVGVWLWSNLGDRTSARTLIAAGGYFVAGFLVFLSLLSGSIALVLAFFSAAVFCTAAYTAAEFAMLQRALPAATIGEDVGLYNGLTTMVGGGLGPLIVSAIVGDPEAAGSMERLLVLPITCTLLAGVLLAVYARQRY